MSLPSTALAATPSRSSPPLRRSSRRPSTPSWKAYWLSAEPCSPSGPRTSTAPLPKLRTERLPPGAQPSGCSTPGLDCSTSRSQRPPHLAHCYRLHVALPCRGGTPSRLSHRPSAIGYRPSANRGRSCWNPGEVNPRGGFGRERGTAAKTAFRAVLLLLYFGRAWQSDVGSSV